MKKKELYAIIEERDQSIELQAQLITILKQSLLIATTKADKLQNKVNPVDILDSIAMKTMIDLDTNQQSYDLTDLCDLTNLRDIWADIREEKGLDNE